MPGCRQILSSRSSERIGLLKADDQFTGPASRPTSLPAGAFCASAAHAVSYVSEQVTNSFQMIALNFQQIVFDSAAGTASGFQLAKYRGQVVLLGRQPSDHGNELALLTFLNVDPCRLFLW